MAHRILAVLGLLTISSVAPLLAAQNIVHLSVDATKPGAKIDRNLFGQFAENLGHGLYEGIWVGPDSSIPNTRGIRNDVVAALRQLKVPNVRWPGSCFADQYHWRKGIDPRDKRPAIVDADLAGFTAKSAKAETLTGVAVDTVNTFESPNEIVPKPTAVKLQNGKLSLTVAPRSVTIVSIE